MRMADPMGWSCDEVGDWLTLQGFHQYAPLFSHTHKIDGQTLLGLSEDDLRRPPMSIPVLGDMKRVWAAICRLKASADPGPPPMTAKVDTPAKSSLKTAIATAYFCIAIVSTTLVEAFVDARVPDMKKHPPLPDLLLDTLPVVEWAFSVCEALLLALLLLWGTIVFFHPHRMILMSRMFALAGTMYLMRCVTLVITSLSVPCIHHDCGLKEYTGVTGILEKAEEIRQGGGLSMKGVRSCGDYMYSGHTTTLTLLAHFITEYSPKRWYILHALTWAFGIFFILLAHEHYSIDCFVAVVLTTWLCRYYHSLCYLQEDQRPAWTAIPLFALLECGRSGPVQTHFQIPLPRLMSKGIRFAVGVLGLLDTDTDDVTETSFSDATPSSAASDSGNEEEASEVLRLDRK